MAFWTPFFPFELKCKQLSRRHVMIAVRTFLPEIKTISSSFFKSIYIFDIFYQFYQFERTESEVWKGKILCALGVKIFSRHEIIWPISFLKKCIDVGCTFPRSTSNRYIMKSTRQFHKNFEETENGNKRSSKRKSSSFRKRIIRNEKNYEGR